MESFPVLGKLGERDLAVLRSVMASKEYGRGECVLPTGDETSNIVAIRKGSVNISLASPDGREMALRYRNAGDLASLPADGAPGTIPIVAQARVDETLVSLIPGNAFWAMTMAHPEAMEELIPLVRVRLLDEEKLLYSLFALTIRARLARTLVELAEESADAIVRTRQDDLATLVGTTRQEVTRILGCLRDRGWIAHEPHSHEIRVLNVEALLDRK